jgi:KaiC/GvpD/RAD55 family RecA-like ATPase
VGGSVSGFYEFNPEDARRFARDQNIGVRTKDDELIFRKCPYCGRTTTNDKEKFSINLKTGVFQCFRASCGAKGNMLTLHKDFGFSLGSAVDSYYDQDFRRFKQIRMKKPESKDPAIRYMASRGISEAVTREYGITVQKDHDNILVFPFMDETGTIQFVKYRKTDFDKEKDKNKEWCEANCKPILFGMYQCDLNNKQLVLTEGQIDSLSVTEAGIKNAVSVPTGARGFTWVPYCWDWLQKFDTLIVFGDYEKGHITLLEDMRNRFHGQVKHVREEDYQGCKDANELLQNHGKDAVKKAVEQAESVKNKKLKYAVTIKRVDLNGLERMFSGIPKLDTMLGGFYMGQTILLSGERGKGKSTLASQFATKAISQGYGVMFYSGELIDWYWKAWIDFQVAGKNYINTRETDYGPQYSIDASVIPLMENWYGDKLVLYDNNEVSEDDDEGLLDTVKDAIIQYDCRVIFLDNLMTAIEDDGKSDLYRQQSNWVKKLVAMGKKFNVLIFLIAHPRKGNGLEFSNDSVAGSSNITNLVDVVLNYDSPKEEQEYPRELKVTKNRLTGRVTKKGEGIPLYFEESSKRISENGNFGWTLGWEPANREGFIYPTNVDLDVPFD